jgi:Mg2+-importing ATPase
MNEDHDFWSIPTTTVLEKFRSRTTGLTSDEASSRLIEYGENSIEAQRKTAPLLLFLSQFKNPIIIILFIATAISAATGEWLDSMIILAIIFGSAVLSFMQEYSANNAVDDLRTQVQIKSIVLRNGNPIEIPSSAVVPGDIVMLSAGSLIPADGLIIECQDFYVNQSILTGEAYPVEKKAQIVPRETNLAERKNSVFMGTNVRSGTAKMLVIRTGAATEFGKIAKQLTLRPPETEFEQGIRRFGYLLTEIMLILTLVVFAINVIFQKPAISSLLFSVALAVGITPQLLPAIINITLAKGSRNMAKKGVIVRRLTAIENFGSMDILCADKTGTLTEGIVRLDGAVDTKAQPSDTVFRLAFLNSSLQTGLVNPLDEAIIGFKTINTSSVIKLGEIPYDFFRKRLSVIIQDGSEFILIVKGALSNILEICTHMQVNNTSQIITAARMEEMEKLFAEWSNQGFRVLGIAQKQIDLQEKYSIEDETDMIFMGFLLFFDPPKTDVSQTIVDLDRHGVQLRIITGDNKMVAMHIANAVGLPVGGVMTGAELMCLNDEALWNLVETTNLFVEVDPNQKERIILALKKKSHVVGYMGDGINDAPALYAADVGISINTAVDVAKEAADFVLLKHDLDVLVDGIKLGRATFANTLKYIFITTSANFGNMFSMAGASLFMPFLPLLPKQILLINFITDFPAISIASDYLDPEMVEKPRRWNISFIRDFMFTFGFISSAFDYLTFVVLLIGFNAQQDLFRSSWFVLSVITELLILLVMRTQKPFFKSKPAPILLFGSIGTGIITLLLPYLPFNNILNITPIPPLILLALLGIAILYIITTEIGKHYFYKVKTRPKLK